MGGQSKYTPELAEAALEELETHGSALRAAKAIGISRNCLINWVETYPEFGSQYARAKSRGVDALVEETIDIADNADEDYIDTEHGPRFNSEHVQRSKIRIETRRWFAERLEAQKYGVRTGVDVTNSDGTLMDDNARANRLKALIAAAEQRKTQADEE